MIHVYVGPTLHHGEPLLAVPRVRVLPPMRHGDLFDPAVRTGDTVVLIDGMYHQVAAVRHKELLAVMDRGVRVIGAASIGALRAAELSAYGMTGVGAVFRAYLGGDLDGDDEVAVGQQTDGSWRSLTWPLVNLRRVLAVAEHDGIVAPHVAAGLLAAVREVYYPHRTLPAVLAVSRRNDAEAFAAWFQKRLSADPHFGDVKRADALEALLLALATTYAPQTAPATVRYWDTGYYRRWVNHAATDCVAGVPMVTARRVAYQQLFDPGFRAVWRTWLGNLSEHPSDGTPGMPLTARVERLTKPHGRQIPPHALFRPVPDLSDPDTVARLLAHETAADRTAITRYAACNDTARRTQPGFCPEALDDRATARALQRLWHCPGPQDLEDEATARGFHSSTHAAGELKHFMTGLLHDQEQHLSNQELTDAQ
ncbi:TfuA-like protein [Streptomyces sp. NBC_00212]|uniref:TfuA-like protein n=1 Tax=Streptomyces sp. NBC_00212 TaxID=2975684 RepID=UPI002F9193BE